MDNDGGMGDELDEWTRARTEYGYAGSNDWEDDEDGDEDSGGSSGDEGGCVYHDDCNDDQTF